MDQFFNRRYSTGSYNCAHFTIEVWKHLTGQDLNEALHGFLCAPSKRQVDLSNARRIRLLKKPEPLCLVLMQRPGFAHVGIWRKNRVLHLVETGVQFMPIEVASLGYSKIRFFLCV